MTFDLLFGTFTYTVDTAVSHAAFGRGYAFDPGLGKRGVRIRCDRGVARAGSDGCIFPQAAAVFVVSDADGKGAEAVEHLHEALEMGAPGRFRMRAGFRAVADDTVVAPGMALQRTQIKAVRDANRYASCGSVAGSIIRQRPNYSASCADGQGTMLCDCDEYPFASTYQGTFENRETTSAKYILSSDNRAVGSALSAFYSRQRVLDMLYDTGGTTSRTNPYGTAALTEIPGLI